MVANQLCCSLLSAMSGVKVAPPKCFTSLSQLRTFEIKIFLNMIWFLVYFYVNFAVQLLNLRISFKIQLFVCREIKVFHTVSLVRDNVRNNNCTSTSFREGSDYGDRQQELLFAFIWTCGWNSCFCPWLSHVLHRYLNELIIDCYLMT